MLTAERFTSLTNIVIDNFEGGYYHPDMLSKFKPSTQAIFKDSGETMFGLDRMAGAQLAVYPEWKRFWDMIDNANARTNWKHNSLGGALNAPLKELASKIMYQWFNHLAAKYLFGDSIDKISADDRLVIHFSYASWNGEGWFQKYAKALNAAKGTKEQIFQEAIKARTLATKKSGAPNIVIRQQGVNMMNLFARLHL